MGLKYGRGDGVKRGRYIIQGIQRTFCKEVLRIPRRTAKGEQKGNLTCSVVQYWYRL
jgi:hypothetical protein